MMNSDRSASFMRNKFEAQRDTDLSHLSNEQLHEQWRLSGEQRYKDDLMLRNLGFVTSIAKKYHENRNLSFDDFVSYGSIGLLEAIERYHPAKGSFLTFAHYRVIKAISGGLRMDSTTVRVPSNVYDLLSRLKKVEESAEYSELADTMDEQQLVSWACECSGLTQKEYAKVADARLHLVAPAAFLAESMDVSCGTSKMSLSPEAIYLESIEADEMPSKLASVLHGLSALHQQVVRLNMTDGPKLTQNDKASKLGISVRAVAKLEKEVKEHMRANREELKMFRFIKKERTQRQSSRSSEQHGTIDAGEGKQSS
jgi:RNA polymerase sigma factor for flagellar operon FliA